jgi:hypothetical protein
MIVYSNTDVCFRVIYCLVTLKPLIIDINYLDISIDFPQIHETRLL